MEQPDRIPIFPLNLVLFPGMALPLHIFEPRYKRMTRRCLDQHLRFGVILATEKGVATIGTTAEIVQKVREYPDGRMDILTSGQSVFSVQEIFDSEEYYEARIDYPQDTPQPDDPIERAALAEQFNQCHILLFGQPWSSPGETEPFPLSYRISAFLPLGLLEKQRLLETRGERDRRAFLHERIARLIPRLAERQRIRRGAGGNGHALN